MNKENKKNTEAEHEFYVDLLKQEIDNLSVKELRLLLAFLYG